MSPVFRVTLLLLVLVTPTVASASAVTDLENLNLLYDRILLPIGPVLSPIAGENGSLWSVQVVGMNNSKSDLYVTPLPPLPGYVYTQYPRPVGAGALVHPGAIYGDPNVGEFLFVDGGRADDVAMSLRVQDLSRQAQTWGTAIPVVRKGDVFTHRLNLLDIPVTDDFRVALRIYDFDEAAGRTVQLRIFALDGTDPLVSESLTLTKTVPGPDPWFFVPGAVSLGNLVARYPQLRSVERVRIEITPVTPGLRFWAFASITNNATQHITLGLPQ